MTARLVTTGPEWRLASYGKMAHLVADSQPLYSVEANGEVLDTRQSWCGAEVGGNALAPYAKRCKVCLARLRRYLKDAEIEPPELITETVTVTVTRPAGSVSVADVVSRAPRTRKWQDMTVTAQEGTA